MAFTKAQVQTFHEQASEVNDMLSDAVDSASEWLDTMQDKEADDDDKGIAEQNLEDALDTLEGILVSLLNLVEGM